MVSLNGMDEGSNSSCEYDIKCEKSSTNECFGCGQRYCLDHYIEHENKVEKSFEDVVNTHQSLIQKLKMLISSLSSSDIFDLIEDIYQLKIKSNEIEKKVNLIKPQLKDFINKNKENLNNEFVPIRINELNSDQNDFIENSIKYLTKDLKQFKLKLKQLNEDTQSEEKFVIKDLNVQLDKKSETIKFPLLKRLSLHETKSHLLSNLHIPRSLRGQQSNDTLSNLLSKQINPSLIDNDESELDLTDEQNNIYFEGDEDDDEDINGIIDSDTSQRITRKIRLSNNIIKYMRGPLRIMLDGTMHIVEVWAKEAQASEPVKEAIRKGLERQKNSSISEQTKTKSIKFPYVEITSDWTFLGENSDRGFSSASIWMRNPLGQRILVKNQDHPLCAANEWLAYVLGRKLGLPINEVQISIYQNKLVTLHTDVNQQNEKILTFMDLPKQISKKLLTDPVLQSMDLFDRIIQNVDRNPRNILITMPSNIKMDDDTNKFKVYLIDHSSCFGMGKLNGISVVATKIHSQHLSVVKFDPQEQAGKFERYLIKLPTKDRILIKKTLNRFASISNNQFDTCMAEIQDLLSPSQYNRIQNVLYRQRDIVRRYAIQWGLYSRSSTIKSNRISQLTSEMNDTVTYF